MKRLLRSTLSDLAYHAGWLTDGHDPGLRILTYHRVTDAHPRERLCVPVARFEEQMRWLRDHGYRTMTLAKAMNWLEESVTSDKRQARQETSDKRQVTSNKSNKLVRPVTCHLSPVTAGALERRIVLTFDDGYEDNFRYAAPATERYGFTGVFFVPSGFIEERATDDQRQATSDKRQVTEDRPMSWEQLRELLRRGHEIGGHSVSHRRLASLEAIEMFWEVRGCKETLEQALRHPVDAFCYPSGDYNEMVKRAVMRSGYRGACTVEPGANVPGADPFALKRTEVSAHDTLWDFEKKLAGAYDWLHRAVQRTGKRSP